MTTLKLRLYLLIQPQRLLLTSFKRRRAASVHFSQQIATKMANILDQPAVQSYIVYSAILALKLLGTAVLTSRVRIAKKVFANPEDAKKVGGSKVKFDDPDVERVRRAHLNDLENIPVFWVVGALFLTTSPAAAWATLLFRLVTAGRVLHTIVYAVRPLPQPARGLAFGIPYLITIYMGIQVVFHYMSAL